MNELPERWHIRVEADGTPDIVRDWRIKNYDWRVKKYGGGWRCAGYLNQDALFLSDAQVQVDSAMGESSNYKPSVEITLEQFKQFVLNNGIRRLWKLKLE